MTDPGLLMLDAIAGGNERVGMTDSRGAVARSDATKQSSSFESALDSFAPLAMTK